MVSVLKDARQQPLRQLHTGSDKCSLCRFQQAEPAWGVIKCITLATGVFSIQGGRTIMRFLERRGLLDNPHSSTLCL